MSQLMMPGMYSPNQRIYTTPEVSGPGAGIAIMQQIRLENILRKYGHLDSCDPYVYGSGKPHVTNTNTLHEIKTPPRTLRPDPAGTTWEKLWKGLTIPQRMSKLHPEKFPPCLGTSLEDSYKNKRSGLPGDPYLQKNKDTTGGRKHGGVNLTQLADTNASMVIFRPFLPQKSPQRLPCIQREKSKQAQQSLQKPPELTTLDVCHQIDGFQKKKSKDLSQQQADEEEKRIKKRVHREYEFRQWEQSQDAYLQRVHAFDADQQILDNFERFHAVHGLLGAAGIDAEQVQRNRISDEIRRGVRERKRNMFQDGGPNLSQESKRIPIGNMTFVKDNAETFDLKKTLVQNVKVIKKGKKKKHLL